MTLCLGHTAIDEETVAAFMQQMNYMSLLLAVILDNLKIVCLQRLLSVSLFCSVAATVQIFTSEHSVVIVASEKPISYELRSFTLAHDYY